MADLLYYFTRHKTVRYYPYLPRNCIQSEQNSLEFKVFIYLYFTSVKAAESIGLNSVFNIKRNTAVTKEP